LTLQMKTRIRRSKSILQRTRLMTLDLQSFQVRAYYAASVAIGAAFFLGVEHDPQVF